MERFENASRRIPALREKKCGVRYPASFQQRRRYTGTASHARLTPQRNAQHHETVCVEHADLYGGRSRSKTVRRHVAELRLYFSFGVCAVYRSTAPGPLGCGLLCAVYHVLRLSRSYGDLFYTKGSNSPKNLALRGVACYGAFRSFPHRRGFAWHK